MCLGFLLDIYTYKMHEKIKEEEEDEEEIKKDWTVEENESTVSILNEQNQPLRAVM